MNCKQKTGNKLLTWEKRLCMEMYKSHSRFRALPFGPMLGSSAKAEFREYPARTKMLKCSGDQYISNLRDFLKK